MTDRRKAEYRESEIIAQLQTDHALSVAWLQANRNRPAALERLIAAGKLRRLPSMSAGIVRVQVVRQGIVRTLAKRLARRWAS